MTRMKPPSVPVVPEDGLHRLLAVCAGKGFEARRDTAIVTLLLDTGARSGEFAGLRVAGVDFDLDMLLVLEKGRRERVLPFGRTAALALDRYLRARLRHPQAHLAWLWLGKKGGLTASGARADAGTPRPPGGPARPAPPPAAPHLRAPVARRRRW